MSYNSHNKAKPPWQENSMSKLLDYDLFKCPRCKERYDLSEKSPVILDCAHSMCLDCVRSEKRCDEGNCSSRQLRLTCGYPQPDMNLRLLLSEIIIARKKRSYVCFDAKTNKLSNGIEAEPFYCCPCCKTNYRNIEVTDKFRVCHTLQANFEQVQSSANTSRHVLSQRYFICLDRDGFPIHGMEGWGTDECSLCHSSFEVTNEGLRMCSKFTDIIVDSNDEESILSSTEDEEEEKEDDIDEKYEKTGLPTDSNIDEEEENVIAASDSLKEQPKKIDKEKTNKCHECEKMHSDPWLCLTCEPRLAIANAVDIDDCRTKMKNASKFCFNCAFASHMSDDGHTVVRTVHYLGNVELFLSKKDQSENYENIVKTKDCLV